MFQKATKKKSKLRAAIYGLSGGGKTFTSLQIAKGFSEVLKKPIAFIDSELGSASKYSDRFEFDVLELDPEKRSIQDYVNAINEAKQAKYEILVIDSLSHAWTELLIEVEQIAKAKFKGNTWSAWSEGTPKQKQLIDSITSYPGHVICTMRAKTEYENSKNTDGKTKINRLGLAPEQGKGIEYEFDFLAAINQDHILEVQKDRTGKFQDKLYNNPDSKFGIELISWLNEGEDIDLLKIIDKQMKDGKLNSIKVLSEKKENIQSKFPDHKQLEEAIAKLDSIMEDILQKENQK